MGAGKNFGEGCNERVQGLRGSCDLGERGTESLVGGLGQVVGRREGMGCQRQTLVRSPLPRQISVISPAGT